MSTANVKLGTLSNKLDMSESSLTGSKNDLTEFISDIKDVDITQAITEWYNAQYAYQASNRWYFRRVGFYVGIISNRQSF